jgi:hypothetical protein
VSRGGPKQTAEVGHFIMPKSIPKDSVVDYETSIKAGKFLLIAHGTADEVQHARQILQNSEAELVNVHQATAERNRAA